MAVLTNLQYSVRSLIRAPGLALALLLSIAIGIGGNAVVYGFVRGLIASALHAPGGEIAPDVAHGLERVAVILRIAAAAVFFVACANVSGFLLARVFARSRETSLRVAIGASRAHLGSQLLSDSAVIAVAGAATGLLLAWWTSNILPALLYSEDAEHLVFAPDFVAIATSAAVGVLITIACGLLPLFEMRDDRPALVLQRESAGPSRMMRRIHSALVVTQMTCCCVLLTSAGLLLQSFRSATETSAARRLGHPILATLQVHPDAMSNNEVMALGLKYFRDTERAARSVDGISSTAWIATLPGGAPTLQSVRIEQPHGSRRAVTMTVAAFTPASLPLVSMPPVAGRLFGGQDTADSCRVGVIDQPAANRLFGGEAIGRTVEDQTGQRIDIIGVVAMRHTAENASNNPTIFYYPNQIGSTADLASREFQVPTGELTTAELEANVVSRSFFDMMGLSAVSGTLFEDDPAPGGCGVGVVNAEAAEQYFGGNAVGGAIIDAQGRRTEIVGVVEAPPLLALQRRVEPTIYLSMAQRFLPRMAMLVATEHPDRKTVKTVHRSLERVPGAFRPPMVTTLHEHLSQTALAPLRIATTLIGASAVMALLLGGVGLYGAMTEAARQRRRETALRIALGSQAWRVRRDVLIGGARLAGAGTFAGWLGALGVARLLSRIAPLSGSLDLSAWVVAPLILLIIVAVAGLSPARRAVVANPLRVIRGE